MNICLPPSICSDILRWSIAMLTYRPRSPPRSWAFSSDEIFSSSDAWGLETALIRASSWPNATKPAPLNENQGVPSGPSNVS